MEAGCPEYFTLCYKALDRSVSVGPHMELLNIGVPSLGLPLFRMFAPPIVSTRPTSFLSRRAWAPATCRHGAKLVPSGNYGHIVQRIASKWDGPTLRLGCDRSVG